MILILPTTTGYVVGVTPDNPAKAWKAPKTVRTQEHLPPQERRRHRVRVRRWMRLSKRYAN